MINFNNVLLLGSKSPSRQQLLRDSQIPFALIDQRADESQCDWGLSLPHVVQSIARHKMNHLILSDGKKEGEVCFVLTADTLSQSLDGTLHGKPTDRADAIAKIKDARKGARLCSAFCLEKKIWRQGTWYTQQKIEEVVHASYIFDIPDEWIDIYLERSIGMQTAGAIAVEGYGAQFLKMVDGSYPAIVGLPMFELRHALEKVGFFN
ncbi:MAG TPA: Maf family protein [Candidatus Dependentiae bacterium]|nr:Maf family protein [Candidatus Dependentiae bacterium]HRQ62513.1 Maf family protein [Candidatus Dependentiae bacterium]